MNVSLLWGLLLAAGSGRVLLDKLKFSCGYIEKLVYALLIGLGLQSLWMFVFDILNFQFSQPVLTVINLVFIIAFSDFNKIRNYKIKNFISEIRTAINFEKENFNAGSLLVWLVIFGLFYLIAVKSIFWPTTEHDAIGTFDKLGIWYAIEGKIHVSLYDVKLQGAGGIYPPLFPCSIAYIYLYGGENPKILSLLYYLSSLLILFFISKRYVSSFGAVIFTLVLAWAPEFFSHAALLLSNLPSTAYVTMATLPLFVWYKENDFNYFKLAALGIFFSLWLRQDLIAFAVAGGLLTGIYFLRTKKWKPILFYSLSVIVPFGVWSLYVKYVLKLSPAERFGAGSIITLEKIKLTVSYFWAYFGTGQTGGSAPGYFLYGIAFIAAILLILFSVKSFFQKWGFTLAYFAVALFVYTLVFLLIDEKLQEATLQSLMESSFKRGLFCFMPIILFQASVTERVIKFFSLIESYLNDEELE